MKTKVFTYLFICFLPFVVFSQWSDDPNQNTMINNDSTGSQAVPLVVRNSSGETYVAWYSEQGDLNYDVFLQKLDKNGFKLWDEGGLLISDHLTQSWVTRWDMILDNNENVILVNQDQRTGNSNVFAYKISPGGDFMWGDDGIQLSNTPGFDPWPQITLADNGDAVFMWNEEPPDTTQNSTIFLKSVSEEGNILWETNLADTAYDCMLPQILHTESDDFIVSWITKSNLPDTIPGQQNYLHVFAQKIGNDGNAVWEDKIQIDSGFLMTYLSLYTTPYLTSDQDDGAYIMWQGYYSSFEGGHPTTYVNRLYKDGSLWNPNGRSVSRLLENYHTEATMTYQSEVDKLMVSWNEYHYDGMDCFGIYGQLFNPDGQYSWDENGKEIIPLLCAEDTSYMNLGLSESSNDNTMLVYQKDFLSITESDTALIDYLYSTAIDSDGNFVWDPGIIPLSLTTSNKLHSVMSNLIDNQWVIAWEDNIENPDNYFNTGIYAQNLSVDGPVAINTQYIDNNPNIVVFPNPANNQINISYDVNADGMVQLDLLNVNGQLIEHFYEGKKNRGAYSNQLDVSDLTPGMYLIKLQSGNSVVYHKMIKN